MEPTKKVFFRASEGESWEWRKRATERQTSLDAVLREAAERYALIPPSGAAEARASSA